MDQTPAKISPVLSFPIDADGKEKTLRPHDFIVYYF